jgi:hypothetical protein
MRRFKYQIMKKSRKRSLIVTKRSSKRIKSSAQIFTSKNR